MAKTFLPKACNTKRLAVKIWRKSAICEFQSNPIQSEKKNPAQVVIELCKARLEHAMLRLCPPSFQNPILY